MAFRTDYGGQADLGARRRFVTFHLSLFTFHESPLTAPAGTGMNW
jgi:hypothetical protein